MRGLFFVILVCLLTACQSAEKGHIQPDVLTKNSGFDLEKVTFKEDIPLLFSESLYKWLTDSVGNPDFEELKYLEFDPSGFTVPVNAKQYGYLYESSLEDSIAFIDSVAFNKVWVLTDMDTCMVAVYCETELTSETEAKKVLAHLRKRYGDCSAVYDVDSHFNSFSYEWDLDDRILQIERSRGFSFYVGTDCPEGKKTEYCKFECLIVKKDKVDEITKMKKVKIEDFDFFLHDRFVLSSEKIKVSDPLSENKLIDSSNWGF